MNSARTWIFGLGALMLVVLVAAWTLGISPTLDQVSAANEQTAQIQSKNAASAAQLTSLKAQFADIASLKTNLNTMRLSIPETESASAFLNEINVLSVKDGVSVETVTLQDAVVYAAPVATPPAGAAGTDAASTATPSATPAATPSGAAVTPAPASNGLVLIPISVEVTGTLAKVQAFVRDIQVGDRLFVSTTLAVASGSDTGLITGTVTGNIFTLNGTSDPSPKVILAPVPTITPTPTLTPTPTGTAAPSSTGKTGSTGGTTHHSTPPVAPSGGPSSRG